MTVARAAADLFETSFGQIPSGVWSAPGRVNLIGEHTDYTGGYVMPFAIDQRAAIAARPRTDRHIRAAAAGLGMAEVALDDVRAGAPEGWLAYLAGAVRVAESAMGPGHGWDFALVSDVPVGAGLSSSAALTCCTLLAANDLDGWDHDRQVLALWAQEVENVIVGTPCGIMDQTASLLCAAGHVLFLDTRSLETTQIAWDTTAVGVSLMVTDTRAPHVLADGQYAQRRRWCEEAAAQLGIDSLRDADPSMLAAAGSSLPDDPAACARHVVSENARVLQARACLEAGDVRAVGPLLTSSHASLRDDMRVTVPRLDVAVESALEAGALGARMVGGGFGGSTLTLVDDDSIDAVRRAVDAAYSARDWQPPHHRMVSPSAGAARDA